MLTRFCAISATALLLACSAASSQPMTSPEIDAAQAKWLAEHGNDLALAGPRAVPPIPIRIISPKERAYNSPEAQIRRATLCEERGEENYQWCE